MNCRIQRVVAVVVLGLAMVVGPSISRPRAFGQVPTERPLVLYEPPMFTEVIDPFRPPAHVGAPGNRGLEYGDSSRRAAAAAAGGEVTHAGSVAGTNTVTVEHDDGIRTTYTGLIEVWVEQDTRVEKGVFVGRADDGFHFGARLGDHYLDPQVLLDTSRGGLGVGSSSARLVPVGE